MGNCKVNKAKNGDEFHNYGKGKDRVVVVVPKNNPDKPAVFDNEKKLNKK